MKVVFVANDSIHTIKWVQTACQKGLDVVWIKPTTEKRGCRIHVEHERLRVFDLSTPWRMGGYMRSLLLSRRIIAMENPDVIHGHYLIHNGFIAAISSGNRPLVLSAWGTDVTVYLRHPPIINLLANALKKANLVTTCGEHLRKRLVHSKLVQPEICINLPFGIDEERFRCQGTLTADREFDIISTRNHRPIYDNETLLYAIYHLKKCYGESLRCLMVGHGPETHALVTLAKALELHNQIVFVGQINNERMQDILCKARLYVSCSPTDGASTSLLEAMSCELVPIVTDIPANRQWVNQRTGRLFVPVSPKDLADKIAELMCLKPSEIDRMGSANRKIVLERGSLTRTIGKLVEYYENAIKHHNS